MDGLNPHSCAQCEKLVIRSSWHHLKNDSPASEERTALPLDFSVAAGLEAVKSGCLLAIHLLEDEQSIEWHSSLKNPNQWKLYLVRSEQGAVMFDRNDLHRAEFCWQEEPEGKSPDMSDSDSSDEMDYSSDGLLQEGCESSDLEDSVLGESSPRTVYEAGRWVRYTGVIFTIVTTADDPAAGIIHTRPIIRQPRSEYAFDLARQWYSTCLKTHKECHSKVEPYQPTRLLEIKTNLDKTNVHLVCTTSLDTKFVALSYVWGGDQPNKLVQSNIDSWTSGRPLNSLAPTIRDAVVVTTELGLKHLWVDSLCIVQDDTGDKMKEISQMAGIYEGAEVTIVAGEAGGVNVGFLNDRVVTTDLSCCFKLPYFCYLKEEMGSVVLFKDILHDKSYAHPPGTGTWAVNQRAWTLQERLLSRRILEYGPLKHGWLCREVPTPDMNFIGGWTATPQRWEDMPPALLHKSLATLSKVDSPTRLLEEWHDLVEEYKKRKLTEPTDRILAIAGLAGWYSKGIQAQYLAGLWRSGFLYELLWHASNGNIARPKEYQGLSWSWTSINTEILRPAKGRDDIALCELVDAEIDLGNGPSLFGQVNSAAIRIKGPIRLAQCSSSDLRTQNDQDRDSNRRFIFLDL